MKALFVVNERSGRRRSFDVSEVIRRAAADWEIEILPCGRKEDLDAIVERAEQEAFDVVYAVGGDGTVHETAKRLIGRRPALGILPIGSGNGFARHIGLPLEPAESIASCRGARIVTIDTASVNGRPFLGVMGIGFDAEIAHRFAASNVRGLETYVKEGLQAFTSFRADEHEIAANGTTMRTKAFVIAVANSGQYGNDARIAPLASLQDGLLDVVVVGETSIFAAPLLLARLFHGTFDRASNVTSFQTAEVTIERPAAGPAHLDGEPCELEATLHVTIVPSSLRVLVPDATSAL
ncbi:MAG TPA: diacylglycerol kinase family protein [Thermoanaerobaculia bacterium]|jgi:YegS/Rv2252/BmrU family lipid kinase